MNAAANASTNAAAAWPDATPRISLRHIGRPRGIGAGSHATVRKRPPDATTTVFIVSSVSWTAANLAPGPERHHPAVLRYSSIRHATTADELHRPRQILPGGAGQQGRDAPPRGPPAAPPAPPNAAP